MNTYPSSSATEIALYIRWRLPPPHFQPHTTFYLRLLSTINKLNVSKVVQTIVFYRNLIEKEKGIDTSVQNGYPTFLFHFNFQTKTILRRSLRFLQLRDLLQLRF